MLIPARRATPRMRTSESSRVIPGTGLFMSDEMKMNSAALNPMPSANTTIMVMAENGVRERRRTP